MIRPRLEAHEKEKRKWREGIEAADRKARRISTLTLWGPSHRVYDAKITLFWFDTILDLSVSPPVSMVEAVSNQRLAFTSRAYLALLYEDRVSQITLTWEWLLSWIHKPSG